MARRHGPWILCWAVLGCGSSTSGEQVGGGSDTSTGVGGDASTKSGSEPTSGSSNETAGDTGSTVDTATTTETGAMQDTEGGPGPCFTNAWAHPLELAPRDYVGALFVDPATPARLVFGGETDEIPYTFVVATSSLEGLSPSWELVQELERIAPHDVGDIDGDGQDDLVVLDEAGVGQWWQAAEDGMLAFYGSFTVTGDSDALLRLPGDPRAAIARVDETLWFARGLGDGTFGQATPVPPPVPEASWSAPLVVYGEGLLSVATTLNDCDRACEHDTFVLQIDENDGMTTIGRIREADQLLDVADLDGDGQLDLLLRRDGDGALLIHRHGQLEPDPMVWDLLIDDAVVSDADNDGDNDIISSQEGWVTYRANNDFDFTTYVGHQLAVELPVEFGRAVDLDGNGITEFVMSTSDDRHALFYTYFCDFGV